MLSHLCTRFFLAFFVSSSVLALGSRKPASLSCPKVQITSSLDPPLSAAELRWICGDPESAAYKDVPLYQAAFHLRSFLDRRGYTGADLKIRDGVLVVDPGKPVRLEKIDIAPSDDRLLKVANRYLRQILRPSLLNILESSLQRRLLETGYSCAVVSSTARDNTVNLRVERGPLRDFSGLRADAIAGLKPEALIRFQPFEATTIYDIRLLELYEKRLARDNVVQGTYFKENCKVAGSPIEQSFLLGPPRTLRFGVGVDTENGPLLQTSWRHHRFSDMAAQASFTLQASLVQQSLTSRAEYFPWASRPRLSISPELNLVHERRDKVTQISNTIEALTTKTWEVASAKWSLGAGPAFVSTWFRTDAEPHFIQESSLSLRARAEVRSYSYEIFDAHPQAGLLIGLSTEYRDPALGFPDQTLKISGDGRFIQPLGYCGKGRCIAALRVSRSQTWTTSENLEGLPPSLKTYLGGFESLRGFKPLAAPDNKGNGGLSSVSSGTELRGVDILVSNWEPYVFFDIGAVSSDIGDVEKEVLHASGLGLRWTSPIGLVQAYLAKPSLGSFYFYAAFGGEF